MTERFCVPQGEFSLIRLPERRNELLRAWDAADDYLLHTLADTPSLPATPKLLLINDGFGALAVALAAYHPVAWSDSYLSQRATSINLSANGLPAANVTLLNSLQTPTGPFDAVLIKVPKTLAYLEDLLLRLRPHLQPSTHIMLAGMLKHLSASVWPMLERILGPTTTALAKKKARLIHVRLDPALSPPSNPYPSSFHLPESGYRILNHANVFSRSQLDIGTRFFLPHLPAARGARHIADLGCGNGIIGMHAAAANPDATLLFVDESYMAVASAQQNFISAFGAQRAADFNVSDGLSETPPGSLDLILCNPPFHQQQTLGEHVAAHLFKQAHSALRSRGEFWVVANRHLGYQPMLQKLFGTCRVAASNPKFVVLSATRT